MLCKHWCWICTSLFGGGLWYIREQYYYKGKNNNVHYQLQPQPKCNQYQTNNQCKLPHIPSPPPPPWYRNIICSCIGKYQGDSDAFKNGYYRKLEGPRHLMPHSEGQHLNWARTIQPTPISSDGKPIGSHMLGREYMVLLDTPIVIGWYDALEIQMIVRSPIQVLLWL